MAVLGLKACEKTLDVGEDNASTGQVKNSVLQVRTRGASGDEARVAYPVAVYVFEGDECKGVQTIGDEVQSYDLTLTRAVAMFRMVLTDEEIPSTVTKFKFYYTGGSSTFSPSAGYGCVNSKQTEIRPVADDGTYEIFTLPHTVEPTP